MNFLQSRFYSQLIQFSDYIFLSILWVICSIPLITLVPATISLFSVVRSWKNGTSHGIFTLFFSEFKQQLLKKILMSFSLLAFLAVIYRDTRMVMPIENQTKFFLFFLLSIAFFLVVSALVHYFNLFVRAEEKNITTICKNTLILIVSQFHWTFIGVLVICLASLLVLLIPMMIFILGSFTTYILIQISDKALRNIHVKQQSIEARGL